MLGTTLDSLGRGAEAITLITEALASLEGISAPPEVLAGLQARLGSCLVFGGRSEEASGPIEEALILAQHHELAVPLARGLIAKGLLLGSSGRAEESRLLFEGSAAVSRLHGITQTEMVSEGNLADLCMTHDLPGAEEHANVALALARRWGLRGEEAWAASNIMYVLTMSGRLEEAARLGNELLQSGGDDRPGARDIKIRLAGLEALRGNVETAQSLLSACGAWAAADDVQSRAAYAADEAAIAQAEHSSGPALDSARRAVDEIVSGGLGVHHEAVRLALPIALEVAIELGDLDEADRLAELLTSRPRGEVPPFLRAQLTRARALVADARGDDEEVEENLVGAEAAFRDLGYPYWTARAQLDRAEWLARQGRLEESTRLAGEAAAVFERVGIPPMVARARAVSATHAGASSP